MIVLVSYNRPRTEGLFVNFFAESLSTSGVEVRFFTVRNAIFGRLDIFNLHWPELVTRGSNWPKRIGKWFAVFVLLLRIRLQHIPVVLTVHNLAPHEDSRHSIEGFIQKLLTRSVDVYVYINESSENDYSQGPVILHGKYPSTETDLTCRPQGGVLFFGRLRRYKGIEKLVSAYQAVGSGQLPPLSIVGMADEPSYGVELANLTSRLKDVHLQAKFASDDELNRMVLASRLVALPYEHMYNSGVALLALSFGRPILVPDSPANRALQQELGPEWVHIFPGQEGGTELAQRIMAAYEVQQTGQPDLSRRNWEDVAELYVDLFQSLSVEGRAEWKRGLNHDAWVRHSDVNRTALEYVHGD